MIDGRRQIGQWNDGYRVQRGALTAARFRQQHFAELATSGQFRDCQAAPNTPYSAVETELATKESSFQAGLWKVTVGREQGERNGEIEMVTFFAEIGWSQVDRDGPRWKVETTILERRSNTLAAFAHGGVG